ncbi:hypothetical protein M2336_001664 [Sphingobium sp. B1D7B]|uniref:hypothetical protein n=1 Tax=Sphingobium sp. B1D7B TaxID=2940578 RepID=UPI0022250310|nr:hypothetical protein [Sphingobium sp. B1D7B]MCW2405035.1 hypothetical protein [Sphingobium sp. B1D7B]
MLFVQPTASNIAEWIRQAATVINGLNRRLGTFGSTALYDGNAPVADTDYLVQVDATSGPVVISLPTASPGRQMVIKKIDASGNVVTVEADGADLIDGAASLSISTQWQSYTLMGVSGGWAIL